jgi:predicted ATP-grasp superfamily ATP-dependent carboligase
LRIIIIESVCGLRREIDARLFPEGFGMLRTMASEFGRAGFDVIVSLNKKLKPLEKWLDGNVIFLRDGLNEALRHRPDVALVIAPEKGGELERITSRLKRKGIDVLGAHEDAIRTSADKWFTYLALKGKVLQPRTWKRPPRVEGQILVKPIDGVGCEGIRPLTSEITGKGMIYQEFVRGEHTSCCLLMGDGEGVALSVNKQDVITQGRFEYVGGEIPLRHELAEKCAEVALIAAKALNLRGYCGVDLVVSESPYFIELNPRITTSFIALAQVLQANLGELLVDALIDGKLPPKLKLRGHSIMKIPRAKSDLRVDPKELSGLQEIPEIIAPPFLLDGHLEAGSPAFLAACSRGSIKEAKRRLMGAMEEAFSNLGVDESAIAWA